MEAWFALALPILLSVLALAIYKHKITWFEVLIPIVASIIVISIMKVTMVRSLEADEEYLSNYYVSVEHYDEWNEYIHKTCSYTTCTGSGKTRTCRTHYYDCSYVKTHPEKWEATLNDGSTISITKQKYNSLVLEWRNEAFVDMHRDFHTIDGDAHTSKWNRKLESIHSYEWSHVYSNKPQTAETVFHFEPLDSIERKKVYDYPEVVDNYQQSCLGCSKENSKLLTQINAYLGRQKQIRMYVLLYKGQPLSVAELQRRHWKNGNKNELVICADVDGKWAHSFSWSDDKRLEAEMNSLYSNSSLSIRQKLYKTYELAPKLWQRKHFEDFSYIEVKLKRSQLIWIHIVTLIISIGCIAWGIHNDIHQEDFDKKRKRHKNGLHRYSHNRYHS